MYDPIAEINVLRMNGYTINQIGELYEVNSKYLLIPRKQEIRLKENPIKFWGWRKGQLLEKIKGLESPKQVSMWNLVYYIGSQKIETVETNKPYAVCKNSMNKKLSTSSYKQGKLKIEKVC
jgi:hypothetical protein